MTRAVAGGDEAATSRAPGIVGPGRHRANPPGMTMPPPPSPPPAGPSVTPEMIAFAAEARARPEGQHLGAMDNDMRREMVLLTHVLAARADATHVAVQSGNWSDETTWLEVDGNTFDVPGPGAKVLIPEGVEVNYDVLSDDPIGTIRLDGRLQFPHDRSTRLVVDTIVQDHGHGNCGCSAATCECSRFRIGAPDTPLHPDHTCEIIFPGDTDLDPTVDTLLIGRGFVSMGKVSIHGAPKTAWVKCTQNRPVGATTVTLETAPEGWRVGDEILIGATDVTTNNAANDWISRMPRRDDYVTITAINGATITFTPALAFDRTIRTTPGFEGMFYAVANFTRNVTFRSPPGTPFHRRGHLMFMHDAVRVEYADSRVMGRTRKDLPTRSMQWGDPPFHPPQFTGQSQNATDDAFRIYLMGGDVPWAPDSNVRGRYNWHLHRAGTEPGQAAAEMIGVAADADGGGWAMAHHSSVANWRWCVARRFWGAGFVAESGDEIGVWEHCAAMSALQGSRAPNNASEKVGDDIVPGDFARGAAGFWGRGRAVIIHDCVANGCSSGYVWITRGPGTNPRADRMPIPRAFMGATQAAININSDSPPIWDFIDNKAVACQTGKQVVKGGPIQGHNLRSNFVNFDVWNCGVGIAVEYTGQYSYRNIRLLRTQVGDPGASPRGFSIGQNAVDFSIENVLIRGWNNSWNIAVGPPRGDIRVINSDHDGGVTRNFNWTPIDPNSEPDNFQFLPSSALGDRNTFQVIPTSPLTWDASNQNVPMNMNIVDALGAHSRRDNHQVLDNFQIPALSVQRLLQIHGFWTHNGVRYLLVPDVIKKRWADADGVFRVVYFTTVITIGAGVNLNAYVNRGQLGPQYINGDGTVRQIVFEDILA